MGRIFEDHATSVPTGYEVTVRDLRRDLNGFLGNKSHVKFTLQSIKVEDNGRLRVGWTCHVDGDEGENIYIVERLRKLIDDFEWENWGVNRGN